MRISPYFSLALIITVTLLTTRLLAQGTAGTLDVTYGTQGITQLASSLMPRAPFEVLADGSTLVAGETTNSNGQQLAAVSRLLPSGQLDTSFGVNGYFNYGESGPFYAEALAIQPDGKIIVVCRGNEKSIVLRLTVNGNHDPTFQVTRFSSTEISAEDVALLGDGRVVICGTAIQGADVQDARIYAIRATGGVDPNFATGGRFVFGGAEEQFVTLLCVQQDGKILYGGNERRNASITRAYVGRLTSDGVADASYGQSEGRSFFTPAESTDYHSPREMKLDAQGNCVIALDSSGSSSRTSLMRLTSSGQPDPFFATGGLLTLSGYYSSLPRILIQSDGRIVLALGDSGSRGTLFLRMWRYEWNGTADTSFGLEGQVFFTEPRNANEPFALREVAGGNLALGLRKYFPRFAAVLRVHRGAAAPAPEVIFNTQPTNQTLEIGDDLSLNLDVTHAQGAVLMYSWYRNNTLITRTHMPSLTLGPAEGHDDGLYHVEVTGRNGYQQTSPAFQITVNQPPILSNPPPAEKVLFLNSSVQYSYRYTGRVPANYQFYLNDEPQVQQTLNSAGLISFTVQAGGTPEVRRYRVRVWNSDGETTSEDFKIIIGANPYIYPHPDVLVPLGAAFNLHPQVVTGNGWRSSWKLNGKAQPTLNTLTQYSVGEARLTQAGTYTFTVQALLGTGSIPIRVGVVDQRPRVHIAAAGRKFRLTVPISGPGLTCTWEKDAAPLVPRAGLSGLDGPTLTFDSPSTSDEGEYICTVKLGTRELATAPQTLTLAEGLPILPAFTLAPGQIGVAYSAQLPLPALADRFVIKGLPPGFSYDATAHTLIGTPVKSGRFILTFTAVNPLGSSLPVKVPLEVPILGEGLHGRFYGVLFNAMYSAEVDVSITTDGRYTGKLSASGHLGRVGRASFTGNMANGRDLGTSIRRYHGSSNFPLSGVLDHDGPSAFLFQVENGILEATLDMPFSNTGEEGVESLSGTLTRCPFNAKAPLSPAYTGIFNLGFESAENSESRPGGSSYSRATVSAPGIVTQVGKLADGTAFTLSAPVSQDFKVTSLRYLYGNRGGIQYSYTLTPGSQAPGYLDAAIEGSYYWLKTFSSFKGQTNYPLEINDTVSLSLCGKYLPPKYSDGLTSPLMMNADSGNQNVYVIAQGTHNFGTLGSNHSITFSDDESVNPIGFKGLKFSPATGLFTGSAKVPYEEYFYDPKTDSFGYRTKYLALTCQGLVIRPPNSLTSTGVGYSLVPELFERLDNGQFILLKRSHPVSLHHSD